MLPTESDPASAPVLALLRASGLFDTLEDSVLRRIEGELSWYFAPGGSRVIAAGSPCDFLLFVLHGRLHVVAEEDAATKRRPLVEELRYGGVFWGN